MGRVLDVNQVVQQLVDGGHPSSEEVRSCQDHLNGRYSTGRGPRPSWGSTLPRVGLILLGGAPGWWGWL